MRRIRILIVDDEPSLVKGVSQYLRAADYDVLTAGSGEEALALAEKEDLDLIILDLMLPGIDGEEVCRRLRAFSEVPILVLSAKRNEGDRVQVLNLGADDYLTKPFGVQELLARVQAVLRRTRGWILQTGVGILTRGPFVLDPGTMELTIAGRSMRLTRTEFDLMYHLMRRAGNVVLNRVLLSDIWGPEYRDQTEYLRVYISKLRHRIEPDPTKPQYLITVPGVGYEFIVEPPAHSV